MFKPNKSALAKSPEALCHGLSIIIMLSVLVACATDTGDSTTIPDRYSAFLKYPHPEFSIDRTPTTLTTKQVQTHPGNQTLKTNPIQLYAGVTPPPGAPQYFLITHNQHMGFILFKFGTEELSPQQHLEAVKLVLEDCLAGTVSGSSWTNKQKWATCLEVGSIEHKAHGSLTVQGRNNDSGQLEFQIKIIDYRKGHVVQSRDINRLLLSYDEFETLIKILVEVSHPEFPHAG